MWKSIGRVSLFVLGLGAVSACEQADQPLGPEAPATLHSAFQGSRASLPTLVGVAAGSDQFDILVAAVQATDLVGALDGPRHHTVFAPTDEAFLALCDALGAGAGTDEAGCATFLVSTLGVDAVRNVLLYHVTRGDRNATSVVNAGRLRMLSGDVAPVTVQGGTAYIDGAPILVADLRARNGIVHVIGGVILPGN